MKTSFYITALTLCILSYLIGSWDSEKDFEAACSYADIVHSMMDESKDNIDNYNSWMEDFDGLEFSHLKKENLKNYY